MIVGRLSESMPRDTGRLVLFPLLRPLLLFWGPNGKRGPPRATGPRSAASRTVPARAEGRGATRLSPVAVVGEATAAAASAAAERGAAAGAAVGGGAGAGRAGGEGGVVGSGERGAVEGEGAAEASEEALGRCLEDLEKLLTAAPAPPALLRLLSGMGVTVPLFRLHCFCKTAKSRNLQSTKASLCALLPSSATAAADLVSGLLPTTTRTRAGWEGSGKEPPSFAPGPTGGAVLRFRGGGGGDGGGGGRGGGGRGGGMGTMGVVKEERVVGEGRDETLLEMEEALEGLGLDLGLDSETLRLVGSVAGGGGGEKGGPGAGLVGALKDLKEAEGRAHAAAEVLEALGEGSPAAGEVFDLLLRRYLSLRDGENQQLAPVLAVDPRGTRQEKAASRASQKVASEQHAVMASVVVLSERLGARVFGTGMQMLSCIRLVLEHEQPGGSRGGVAGRGGRADGSGCVDAAARVAQMEAAAAAEEEDEVSGDSGGEGEGDDDGGDTLCSVVLALLTTILELGEEERSAEEEEELRAMLGPLKGLATSHRNAEVAEMSALLCASILTRGLTPEQRLEEKERISRVNGGVHGDGGGGGGGSGGGVAEREARTARMLAAMDAAEEDLRSDAVPMRARGARARSYRSMVYCAQQIALLIPSLRQRSTRNT
ncbi:unnamed protein product [Laminaria digitata]